MGKILAALPDSKILIQDTEVAVNEREDRLDLRTYLYVRFGYPMENVLLQWFGKTLPCGCRRLFGRTIRFCERDGLRR